MSKPGDVSRDAPQRASPDNSIKLAHVDDGVTSPETRPKLAARASEQRLPSPGHRALVANVTPQPRREQLAPGMRMACRLRHRQFSRRPEHEAR